MNLALNIKFADLHVVCSSSKTRTRIALNIVGIVIGCSIAFFVTIFSIYYFKYKHIVDERLEKPLFENTAKIYAAPPEVRPGQKMTTREVVQELRAAGYSSNGDGQASSMGTYGAGPESVVVHPGPYSYHSPDSATITFSNGTIRQISGKNGQQLAVYELEPLLITGLSDTNRASDG